MFKNNSPKLKDELLSYYEVLISKLLGRIGEIAAEQDECAKSKLVASIALDFADSNIKDNDIIPDLALQYIFHKKLGTPDDFDAGRYSASEDGFNFYVYCYDLCRLLDFDVDGASAVDKMAGEELEKIYEKLGWTPALRRIKK